MSTPFDAIDPHMSASVFTQLHPPAVWAHFETLCGIPRPSKHESALRDHLVRWAHSQGLAHEIDAVGNLLIRKPASVGCEHAPGVVLQGHLDMVCQARNGVAHDFARDPIRTVLTDDGWLEAPDTTLGADNGIGVALALAVLEDPTLTHGPMEALFTVDEEAGMGGVKGLSDTWLQGRLLLNIDTEEWGQFYLGCAGGLDVNVDREATPDVLPPRHAVYALSIEGLRGGHSGVSIHHERGNAIKLLVRVLLDLCEAHHVRLISLQGGTARNALPRDAFASVGVPIDAIAVLDAAIASWQARLQAEWSDVDPGLSVQWQPQVTLDANDGPQPALSEPEQALWLHSLHASPHGVKRQSLSLPGVVETSNNLGMVNVQPAGGHCNYLVRSLLDSAAQALADEIVSLWRLSGVVAECTGHYPGWTPRPSSPLLGICQQVYRDLYRHDSQVQVIHAGLECGLLGAKYPDMDMVSFGPTIRGAHAPGERVEVATVGHCWELLVAILARLATDPA